jgi:hypothetical protein
MNLTEIGDYDGNPFSTGVASIGDSEARFVVADVPRHWGEGDGPVSVRGRELEVIG